MRCKLLKRKLESNKSNPGLAPTLHARCQRYVRISRHPVRRSRHSQMRKSWKRTLRTCLAAKTSKSEREGESARPCSLFAEFLTPKAAKWVEILVDGRLQHF
ncbi:hypothetical protein ACJQWK_11419 [Exserohilum turcicum]